MASSRSRRRRRHLPEARSPAPSAIVCAGSVSISSVSPSLFFFFLFLWNGQVREKRSSMNVTATPPKEGPPGALLVPPSLPSAKPSRTSSNPLVALRRPPVESRTGALTIGSGGVSVAFASGLSPAPLSRFQSPLSEPDVRFSRIRLSSGIMRLAHRSPVAFVDDSCGIGTLPYSIHFRSRVAARPVDALTTPASSADPFTFACDASGVSGPFPGFQAFATPETLPPSVTAPHLRPLPSTDVTPLPRYYGPLRHPAGPACPSRGPG